MWNRLKAILADFIQQADLVLLGLCCAATLYGMALIASATRYLNIGGIVRYVGVQGAAMVLGICAYIFMSMLDLERLMRRWKWLVAFNVVFIALLLTPFGVSDNTGNTAWLKFPFLPFSIGPAEVVKITFTLLLAKQLEWLREVKRDLKSFPSALMVAGHTIALMGWYVGISGDMGNGLTFFFIFLCMAFVAGFALRWFVLLFAGSGAAIAASVALGLMPDYMINRFRVLFDHSYDTLGAGWQQTRGLLALGSGGLFGQGYMQGTQTQAGEGSLPARHTDFIDLLRLPVDRPAQVETTAFGAAALAGLAAGVWGSLEEVAALRRSQHVFLPQRPQAACEAQYRLWRRAVDRALRWIENDV